MSDPDHFIVEDPHAVFADRAHAQLGLERDAEFADDDYIKGRTEGPGNLKGDRNSASGKTEHNDRLASKVLQPPGKTPSGIYTIDKGHVRLPTFASRRSLVCGRARGTFRDRRRSRPGRP